ncbi:MAG: hypothetical protein U0R23_06870 [Candidatus Nanopelagicales bacterium]
MASSQSLMRTLGAWSAVSVVGGAAVWAAGRSPQARAFGRQTLAWGAVDAAIAGFGASRPAPDPRRLRRILLINCVADLGYLALAAVAWRSGRTGDGAAIAVQGAFLLALDSHYAYHLEVGP